MPRRFVALAAALLLAALYAPAHAVRAPEPAGEADGRPRRVLDAARQAVLENGASWQSFRSRHGAWRALWNERTGTPHLATGPPIALGSRAADPASVDRALRSFVARNPFVFGHGQPPDLETRRVVRAGRVWYASYRRRVGGIPVLFEDWEFRVSPQGQLFAFGADAHATATTPPGGPTLDAAAARQAARLGLGLGPDARVEGGEDLYWMPQEGGAALQLVREVRALTQTPPGHWIALVDARDGAVRWRHDRVRYEVTGAVTGSVHLGLPTGPTQARPFTHQRVTVGGTSVFTDGAGVYSAPATGTVLVGTDLSGSFCDVSRYDLPAAAFSTSVEDPALVHVEWSDLNSHVAERDVFYHVNRIHDHLAGLDPGFTGNDYPMPCLVNYNSTCNAFWDGLGLTFYAAGASCPNIATLPDIVYHEYGHGVNDNLYVEEGATFGMLNGALHEGLADVAAAFLEDDPVVGQGFFGPGTFLRSLANTQRWPDDADSDPHITGLIVAGALWDLRQAVGLATAEQLSHFARYSLPDDPDDGLAMGEYFLAVLVADDDDGNLANGTPNFGAIATAFNAHGIGTGLFLAISHFPLTDQGTDGPYPVVASITYSGPIGGVDPSTARVTYSVNDSPLGVVPLTPLGFDEYTAAIPAPTGTIVRYRIEVAEQFGDSRSQPPPGEDPNVFLAGPTSSFLVHDHESNAGWTPGDLEDTATRGRWEWVAPEAGIPIDGEYVSPTADHTSYGILCYVTEDPSTDYSPGAHDVDNGRTTLTTSIFDATPAGPDPLLEYYRWYTNDLGANPGQDFWRVELSNDAGGSWVPVETTAAGDNDWVRVVFFVRDFATPTPFMRLRFIAEDAGAPSLVEAAVDDLRLLRFNGDVTAVAAPGAALAFATPAPNPSAARVRLAFSLAYRGPVTLAVFDLAGRRVRGLRSGVLEPGAHEAAWDGRDERGQAVSSGLYFARLEAEGRVLTRRVVRSR